MLNAALVLAETDIQLPMQVVLDPPVPAQHLGVLTCSQPSAADEVAHLGTGLPAHRAFTQAHAHRAQLGPSRSVTQAGDLMDDQVGTFLAAAVSLCPDRVLPHDALIQL